jgi:hypothetical protein
MIRTVAIWFGRAVLVSTILLAGGHTLYYLYYWQWVRAQMAGTLFVATLVIAATWLILRRIDHLERDIARRSDLARVAAPVPEVVDSVVGTHAVGSAPDRVAEPQPDFPWLAAELSPPRRQALVLLALAGFGAPAAGEPRTAVFIPVLLGAGLVVSLVAGLAERTATAAYGGAIRIGAVRRLVMGAVAAVVVTGLVVAGIWWSAHYRPVALGAGRTELTVQVSTKASPRPAAETVEIIGRYCARNAIAGVRVQQVEPVSPDSAVLVVSPLLDEQAQRRYDGCLQDVILERHRLTVTGTELVPEATAP